MSVSPECHLEVESSVEDPLSDMANLKLGSSCGNCEELSSSSCTCCCQLKAIEDRKKSTPYPYFWRKTQMNPFHKSKRPIRKRFNGTVELLQPSRLKFIVGPSTSGTGLADPHDGSSSGEKQSVVSTTNNTSKSGKATAAATTVAGSSSGGVVGGKLLSTAPGGVICPYPSLAHLLESSQAEEPCLSLPDFTSLSLTGDEGALDLGASRAWVKVRTTSLEDGEEPTSASEKLSGALLNFKLEPGPRPRYGPRTLKWKSRIRGTFRQRSLPPILEDTESDCLSALNHSAQATTPSSPNLNCSQQALMENSGGGRWSQESSSDPIDDVTIDELASYLDVFVYIPKKMSPMAEMMYT